MLMGKTQSTSGKKGKEQIYNLKIEASEEIILKAICRSKYIGRQMLSFPSKMHSEGPHRPLCNDQAPKELAKCSVTGFWHGESVLMRF